MILMAMSTSVLRATEPYLLGFVIFMASFLVYFYLPYWKVRRIPGPPAKFLVGHLPLLAAHGPDIMKILARNYGPVFRFHMGRQPLVIVADPELCREVGIKKFKSIKNRSSPSPTSGSAIHQQGLFLSRDSRWSSMRNAITCLYQASHLSTMIPTMQRSIDLLLLNIANAENKKEDIPFSELTLRMAIDIIGEIAFGVQFGLSKEALFKPNPNEIPSFLKLHMYSIKSLKMDLSSSFSTIVGLVAPALQIPCRNLLQLIRGTAEHKLKQTNRKLCQELDGIIAKRANESIHHLPSSRDFLSAVLEARESRVGGKELFAESYIRALAYEQLVAGTKTTAFTLTMAVYLISNNADVERKLIQEIDAFGAPQLIPTADDLNTMFPYLDKVIKETMRFVTVSPLVARETSQEVKIGGYVLPKGVWVWLALGALAMDPKQFPEPQVFKPERFDPSCDEEKRRHPYSNIPFGIGPRACIGQKFALQELKLALICLYRNYVFRHSAKMESPLEFEYGLVLGFKREVKIRATKRTF